MKRFVHLAAVNYAVFCSMLVTLYLVLLVGWMLWDDFVKPGYFKADDERASLPNYEGFGWAAEHFREFDELDTVYYSYIGWRRSEYRGQTINIDAKGIRRTLGNDSGAKKEIWFFGGSTMWGTGVDDANTIPSLVAQSLSGWKVRNLGESYYTSAQGLTMLIREIKAGKRPNVIIFYNGVNDLEVGCRRENTPFSHAHEATIRALLEADEGAGEELTFGYLLAPLKASADRFKRKLGTILSGDEPSEDAFVCSKSRQRASAVVQSMIDDWQMAQTVAAEAGARFFGFLQPVSFLSNTPLPDVSWKNARPDLEGEYLSVYPMLREEVARNSDFHDLTDVLDTDEPVYIDFCHLSPNGSRMVARAMLEALTMAGAIQRNEVAAASQPKAGMTPH